MAVTFNGTDLTQYGVVDLSAQYVAPRRRVQMSASLAPGVDGALLQVGGELPQTIRLPIEVRGTGIGYAAAKADHLVSWNTLGAMLKVTGSLVVDEGVTFSNCTMIDFTSSRGNRYFPQGANTIAASRAVMTFFRASFE